MAGEQSPEEGRAAREAVRARAVARYNAGMKAEEAALLAGVSPETVRRWAAGRGRHLPSQYLPKPPGAVAEAVALYDGGMTSREVSAQMEAAGIPVDPTTVTRWAVARRTGPRGRRDLDGAEIVRLKDEKGMTLADIGRRLGVPRETVRNRYYAAKGIPQAGRRGR